LSAGDEGASSNFTKKRRGWKKMEERRMRREGKGRGMEWKEELCERRGDCTYICVIVMQANWARE
jgi:hypothetical protein